MLNDPAQREQPIRLFWWRQKPNFGDGINPRLVSHFFEREVVWSHRQTAELIAVGSLIPMLKDRLLDENPPIVWGSGSLHHPEFLRQIDRVDNFLAIRGYLSASELSDFRGPYGDPALLCPRVEPKAEKTQQVGVVPHHMQWADQAFIDAVSANGAMLIDVRLKDPWEVVRQISSCARVFSNSLHGLIVADAYRVPNYWLDGPRFGSHYKFFDYFHTVGRRDKRPMSLDECFANGDVDLAYQENLPAMEDALLGAIPKSLHT
ncbi:MAG: polysaccharide pyruvyl transferase family protein [Pseudomonadota bacterium]